MIREAFTGARDYRARRDRALRDDEPFEHDLGLEALVRVLDGELPWCQHTHRADDIATALRLAEEFGYRLVLHHGTEGHLPADLLAEKDVPVIFGPATVGRSAVELRRRTLRTPGTLARTGVRLALTTDHPVVPVNYLALQAISRSGRAWTPTPRSGRSRSPRRRPWASTTASAPSNPAWTRTWRSGPAPRWT